MKPCVASAESAAMACRSALRAHVSSMSSPRSVSSTTRTVGISLVAPKTVENSTAAAANVGMVYNWDCSLQRERPENAVIQQNNLLI